MNERELIKAGKTAIGIEFGSTRVKAVLVDENAGELAAGSVAWENQLENGVWTYPLEDVVSILQTCFAVLKENVWKKYAIVLETTGTLGISAMMHGMIVLDEKDEQLAPFVTWRNVNTGMAAEILSKTLSFNMPMRWSASHLYQAVLDQKDYVSRIAYFCTLSAYVHYLLSGRKVIGIGDASGMFPVDPGTGKFDEERSLIYEKMLEEQGCRLKLDNIFPEILSAGADAGNLTRKGALLLDPSGQFKSGVPMVPPEGDAQTGMTATNAVTPGTGNISAGTSVFSMVVLEKRLSHWYQNVDIVMTPDGKEVAMIHCNNGSSDLDAWVRIAKEITEALGINVPTEKMYELFFISSLDALPDAGGIVNVNYLAGEHVTGVLKGHPLLVRNAGSSFNLANLSRAMIYSIFATLSIGFRILRQEGVKVKRITAHGGLFKTKGVAQKVLSAAMEAPVGVFETAAEGGAFGMAILALYRKAALSGICLSEYLEEVFSNQEVSMEYAQEEELNGFRRYVNQYEKVMDAERAMESLTVK